MFSMFARCRRVSWRLPKISYYTFAAVGLLVGLSMGAQLGTRLVSGSGRYRAAALFSGAAAVLTDAQGAQIAQAELAASRAALIVTEDPRQALAYTAALWFGAQPATMVAVTGTNGKTSVATFTRQIWEELDLPAVNLGTTGVEGAYAAPGIHTTPEPITLHRVLAEIAAEGVTHAAMEASSHGLAQRRLDGVHLRAAGFTNFTQDHLDYHASFEEYFDAKAGLFARVLPDDGTAVVNIADARGVDIIEQCEVTGINRDGGKVTGVETTRGTINAPRVGVVVAGNASVVAAMAGLRLPVESHPLQAFVSEPLKPVLDTVVMSNAVHGYISQSEIDKLRGDRDQARAAVESARAAIDNAQINLDFTEIRAPFTGVAGRSEVSIGDLVGPQTGPLVTLVQREPMLADFDVDEQSLANAMKRNQELLASGGEPIRYTPMLTLVNGDLYPHPGELDYASNRVNPGTGTVTITASFPNPGGALVPGQFVRVRLQRGEAVERLLIPQQCVLEDMQGRYVFVIGDGETVARKNVALGQRQGTYWIVESGLETGDRVIVNGIQKVRSGMPVQATPIESLPHETTTATGEG